MQFINLDKTAVYKRLCEYAKTSTFNFRSKLDAQRVGQCLVPMAAGLSYSWAAKAVDEECLKLLMELTKEQDLIANTKRC